MLAALNFGAIALGAVAGSLAATVIGLLLGFGLDVAGLESGPDIGLIVGIVTGLFVGGWISGSLARHSARFHGSITGLLLATLIILIARLGGGPEATSAVVLLAALSVFVGGLSGWLAGRRKARRIEEASPSDGRGHKTEESPDSEGQGAG